MRVVTRAWTLLIITMEWIWRAGNLTSTARADLRFVWSGFHSKLLQSFTFQRGSSSSSGGGTVPGGGVRGGEGLGGAGGAGPNQSGLYDSWKTEWNPTYRDYQTTHYPHPTSSYMTKGGRRSVLWF